MLFQNISFLFLSLSILLYGQVDSNHDFVKYKKRYISNKAKLNFTDTYSFFYNSESKECILKKNDLLIPTFDKRFHRKKPHIYAYKCPAWVKEQYSKCWIKENKSVSAVAMSFGKYEKTNLLIAFTPDYYKSDAELVIECER